MNATSVNTPSAPFRLSPVERQDPVWQRVRGHIEERIDQLRRENDQDLSEVKTASTRGKISALTALLSLDRDAVVTE